MASYKSSTILAGAFVVLCSTVVCNAQLGLGGTNSYESGQTSGSGVQEAGIGGMINGLTGGFGEFLGNLGGGNLGGFKGGDLKTGGSESELLEKKIAEKDASKEGFLGAKNPIELIKLLFNPLELIKQIATFFKLKELGLIEAVGKGVTFGIEVALQPALLSIKIIEKIFVPDSCRLKFVCELGRPVIAFKGIIPKFSPGFLDGTSTVKAFSDGVAGHECEHLYPCGGELKLKKEFELLKSPLGKLNDVKNSAIRDFHDQTEHYGGQSEVAAASNLSPSTVTKQ